MIGAAALLMGASFTSCSKDKDLYDPTANAAKFLQDYQAAFVSVFGTPAANQTWGFGDPAQVRMTRVENTNANEWADPDKAYGGLLVPPVLKPEQIAVVKKYFQTVKNPTYQDPKWTNYFIQQVYKGGDDPINTKEGYTGNASDGKPYSSEKYIAADGHTEIVGSNNMDHLAAIFENGNVDHINNFNHGTCSENHDVLDNGQHVGGTKHTDRIMYMKESTTYSFGYYNSNGSLRHTEYTGLVSFQTIIDALGSEANCLDDGWNRSFMGFDFEQMVGDDIYAKNGWGDNADWAYFTYNNQQYHYLNSNMNMYCGDLKEFNDLNGVDVAQLLSDGYLPVQNSADKKWVKVGGCADGYYSDWIVTLTEAKTKSEPAKPSLHVMAEDMSAKDAGDFDFNDVVFDVFYVDEHNVQIKLLAAGGTLPLRLCQNDAWEVHKLFNVEEKCMVNTGTKYHIATAPYSQDTKPYVTLNYNTPNFTWSNAQNTFASQVNTQIPIEVKYSNEWIVVPANPGEPAGKIACPVIFSMKAYDWYPEEYRWPWEKQDISVIFHSWVIDPTKPWYEMPAVEQ